MTWIPDQKHRMFIIIAGAMAALSLGAFAFSRTVSSLRLESDDIILHAVVRPASGGSAAQADWEMLIAVESYPKGNEVPSRSFYNVYPFVKSHQIVGWDFPATTVDGDAGIAGDQGFTIGSHSATLPQAIRRLKADGFLPVDYPENATVRGFGHSGQNLPAQIKYYLVGPDLPTVAIVVSVQEVRWGRTTGWTKVIYPTLSADE